MKKHFRAAISLVLALVMALSAAIGTFAVSDKISTSTKTDAVSIAKQIQAEGTVLIENKDNLLPLQNKKVSVFGVTSYNLNLGGGGSGSIEASEAINLFSGLDAAGIEYEQNIYNLYMDYIESKQSSLGGNPLVDMVVGLLGSSVDELPASQLS